MNWGFMVCVPKKSEYLHEPLSLKGDKMANMKVVIGIFTGCHAVVSLHFCLSFEKHVSVCLLEVAHRPRKKPVNVVQYAFVYCSINSRGCRLTNFASA